MAYQGTIPVKADGKKGELRFTDEAIVMVVGKPKRQTRMSIPFNSITNVMTQAKAGRRKWSISFTSGIITHNWELKGQDGEYLANLLHAVTGGNI